MAFQFSDHIPELFTAIATVVVCVITYAYTVGKKVSEISELREELAELQSYKANETRLLVNTHEKRMDVMEKRLEYQEAKYEQRFQRLEQTLNEIHTDVGVLVAWVEEQKKH